MPYDTVIKISAASIKFGPGATGEVGFDMKQLAVRRAMVLVDPALVESETVDVALRSLRAEGIETVLFDAISIEPTDVSFQEAARFAAAGDFDGYLAIGGGSTMDTAKAANLYSAYPAPFLTYVNAPLGEARPVPGPLKPMVAIPTTAGTGSETTGSAVFGYSALHVKTAISHPQLRPQLGIIDPNNTRTLPRMVAVSTGWDVLCHAIEALTAIPSTLLPAPANPGLRPAYQGSNAISDVWAAKAIEMVAQNIVRVADDAADDEARAQMLLAATFAGIGFGHAAVHLPHAMSYPVAGMVRSYVAPDYPAGHPMVPHGIAVTLSAPAVVRYTAPAAPERHLWAARLLGVDTDGRRPEEAGDVLAGAITSLMRATGMPNGLSAVGYGPADVDKMVEGTLPQQRITRLAPRPVDAAVLRELFLESMSLW